MSTKAQEVAFDRILVDRFKSGDQAAFNEMVSRYWDRIYAMVHQLLRNPQDAEEVTQDAFIRAHRGLVNFRGEAAFSTWLYQIATNLARNRYWYWWRRKRDKTVSFDQPVSDDNNTPLSEVFAAELETPEDATVTQELVDRIAVETEAVIDDMMPRPRTFPHLMDVGPTIPVSGEAAVQSVVSGYIRFIDTKRLVELAKSYRVAVLVLRRVGHFVPAGLPLLNVSKPERLSPENHAELARVFDIGPSRTLQQDIEYGVLQIVDIALKAISPAVNDPTTAINCIDQLSRILIRFASRESPESVLYDLPGVVRTQIPWIGFDQLLCSAFDQIRHYAKGDIAVSLRLLRALGDLAISTEDPTFHRALVEQGRRITAGCEQHLGEQEMKAIRARLATLEESVSAGQRLPTAT